MRALALLVVNNVTATLALRRISLLLAP